MLQGSEEPSNLDRRRYFCCNQPQTPSDESSESRKVAALQLDLETLRNLLEVCVIDY